MASLGNFNADDFESNNYEPLPVGDYVAMITDSEMKPTQKGGSYLKLTFDIADEKYKGRKVFVNLNLVNSNSTAVEIAKKSLADICRAVGITHPRDSSELHFKPMLVSLVIRPATDQYAASNDAKAFKAIGGAAPAPVAPSPAPRAQYTPPKHDAVDVEAKPVSARKPWEPNDELPN